jgi:hypothetical protein
LVWDIDWNFSYIRPDFFKREVSYGIGVKSVYRIKNGQQQPPMIKDITFARTCPLGRPGMCYPISAISPTGDPEPYGAIIGDDQRRPVFVIGFQIQNPN